LSVRSLAVSQSSCDRYLADFEKPLTYLLALVCRVINRVLHWCTLTDICRPNLRKSCLSANRKESFRTLRLCAAVMLAARTQLRCRDGALYRQIVTIGHKIARITLSTVQYPNIDQPTAVSPSAMSQPATPLSCASSSVIQYKESRKHV
jgi:hypothetical protein